MKFSYSEVWNDAVELLRGNAAIVTALAGVFVFLPMLLTSYFVPVPVTERPEQLVDLYLEYARDNWHWLALGQIVQMIGAISLLLLFLDARGRSVGALIAAAIMILPFYFLASLLAGIIAGVGFLLLIVPGFYLLGRLALVTPEVVATETRNPITAITRSFELTQGKGWAVVGLVLLVAIAGVIIAAVAAMLLGIVFLAIAGQDVGGLLVQIVEAACGAILRAVMIAVVAALYRSLAGPASATK